MIIFIFCAFFRLNRKAHIVCWSLGPFLLLRLAHCASHTTPSLPRITNTENYFSRRNAHTMLNRAKRFIRIHGTLVGKVSCGLRFPRSTSAHNIESQWILGSITGPFLCITLSQVMLHQLIDSFSVHCSLNYYYLCNFPRIHVLSHTQ